MYLVLDHAPLCHTSRHTLVFPHCSLETRGIKIILSDATGWSVSPRPYFSTRSTLNITFGFSASLALRNTPDAIRGRRERNLRNASRRSPLQWNNPSNCDVFTTTNQPSTTQRPRLEKARKKARYVAIACCLSLDSMILACLSTCIYLSRNSGPSHAQVPSTMYRFVG